MVNTDEFHPAAMLTFYKNNKKHKLFSDNTMLYSFYNHKGDIIIVAMFHVGRYNFLNISLSKQVSTDLKTDI